MKGGCSGGIPHEKERTMKKLGNTAVLILLLAATFGAARAWAADSTFMVRNDSKSSVMVSLVWSGGNVAPTKIGPGESITGTGMTVPANIDSVKMQVTGDCKEGMQTFNPQHVTQAVIHCRNRAYSIVVGTSQPKP
jgi:hypothetical protein